MRFAKAAAFFCACNADSKTQNRLYKNDIHSVLKCSLTINEKIVRDNGQTTSSNSSLPAKFMSSDMPVSIKPGTRKAKIMFNTSPLAALKWPAPRQTAGGKQPFLFTHAVIKQQEPSYTAFEKFKATAERRKFIAPLYNRMASDEKLKPFATHIYLKARSSNHALSAPNIDPVLISK